MFKLLIATLGAVNSKGIDTITWPKESDAPIFDVIMSNPLYGNAFTNILSALWADLTSKRLPLPDAAKHSVPE